MDNPARFDDLASRASPRWARWSGRLVGHLRSLVVRARAGGQLVVTSAGPDGTFLDLSRPIPAYRLVRVGSGGLAAANASTGEWAQATATQYVTTVVSDARRTILGTETVTIWNDKKSYACPANVDAMAIEQGGDLIILGHVCPDE